MRRSLIISGCMAMGLALLLSPATNGQTPPEPATGNPALSAAIALDPVYETLTGGIALRPPADSRRIEGAADPDLVVQFVQDEKHWSLSVYRYTFTEPTSLSSSQTNPAQRGLLETTAVNFAASQPGVQLLRQDVVNAGSYDVGLLAMRYGPASQRRLNQQAIFKASDRVFFVLSFNSPSSAPPGDSAEPATEQNNDPQEQQAVATFSAIVDTVHLLDRMYIKREQDERLRRTQALMINFNERKLTQVAQKEQWLRLMRDGRDIGYIYKVEEPYVWGKNSGLLVLTRTRTKPDDATQVDAASSMWTSYDQKEEFWVSNAIVDTGQPGKTELAETGRSYHRIKNVRVDAAQPAGDRNPVMRQVPEYLLSVEQTRGSADGTPTLRELPPYYLSQASGQLLPKLLPLDEPRGYLFVSWVSDRQELMFRYVDVLPDDTVEIMGQKLRAVPITDRVGLEGVPTTHYLSLDGQYLGSRNEITDRDGKSSVSWILPSDAASLEKIWKNPELTRPQTQTPSRKPDATDSR